MTNLELAKEQGNQSAPNVIDAAKASEVQIDVTLAQEQGNQAAPLIAASLASSELYDAIKQQGNQAMPLIVDALAQPEPYTPAPWLRVTGGEYTAEEDGQSFTFTGGVVTIGAITELPLQYSNDGVSWIDINWTFTEDVNLYLSEIFELGNNEQVYFRASEKIDVSFSDAWPIQVDLGIGTGQVSALSIDGNVNALFSPNEEDWFVFNMSDLFMPGSYILHLPDMPATKFVDDTGYDILEQSLNFSVVPRAYACPVSDDGVNFNFHMGVTPEDLYNAGLIETASNYEMGTYLGNIEGFLGPKQVTVSLRDINKETLKYWNTVFGVNMPYEDGDIYTQELVNVVPAGQELLIDADSRMILKFYNKVSMAELTYTSNVLSENVIRYSIPCHEGDQFLIIRDYQHPHVTFESNFDDDIDPQVYVSSTNGTLAATAIIFNDSLTANFVISKKSNKDQWRVSVDGGATFTPLSFENDEIAVSGITDEAIYQIVYTLT